MDEYTFGYYECLPENIRIIFMSLCQDVAHLHCKWDFYTGLFGEKQNNELLAELAPASFQLIYEALQNDITRAICRLSDPSESRGRDRGSLKTLIKQCEGSEVLDRLFSDFQKACRPVRKYKNKPAEYRDLSAEIEPLENFLPGIPKDQISSILDKMADIMNCIVHKYGNTTLYFHPIVEGDAKDLLSWLKKAKASA